MTDYLIVGAGIFGATCARLLTEANYSVKVIERRNHLAGNCYDTQIEGVIVNKYGGHVFHTNAPRIWQFVSRFAEWQPYEHRVKAMSGGSVYSFPPNRLTAQQLGISLGDEDAEKVIRKAFFVGYSEKQWGMPYDEIPRSITRRIPIRDNYDDRYFSDKYQGVPIGGYTAMVTNMLAGIPVETGVDYIKDRGYWDKQAKTVIYTGALDELFDYAIGTLEYRSLTHTTRVLPSDVVGAATLNYCDKAVPYTRIINWRTIGYQDGNAWPVTWEYPADAGEKYYPVPTDSNLELHGLYETLCKREAANIRPGGRLGLYQYLNMDQAIGAAMALVGRLANGG
jgi:UDP-galactopyranose mutase